MDSFNKTIWKDVMQRFNFNIDQMGAKYKSRATSGMVYNIDKDKMEFDPEYCGAEDEETHVRALKREMNTVKEPEGRAIISTPYLDPQEKDAKQITRHAKMNRLFKLHRTEPRPEPYKAILENLRGPSSILFRGPERFRGPESSKTPGELISTLPARLANGKWHPKPNSSEIGGNSTEKFGVNATIQPKLRPQFVTQQRNGHNQSLQPGHINRRFAQVNRNVPRLRAPSPVSFTEWRKSFRGPESSKTPGELISTLPARLANGKWHPKPNSSELGGNSTEKFGVNATIQPKSRPQFVTQQRNGLNQSLQPGHINRRFMQSPNKVEMQPEKNKASRKVNANCPMSSDDELDFSESSNGAEKRSKKAKPSKKVMVNSPMSIEDELDFANTSDQLISMLPARLANEKLIQTSTASNIEGKASGKFGCNATTKSKSPLQSVKQPNSDYIQSLYPVYITRRFIRTLSSATEAFSRQSIKVPRSMLWQGDVQTAEPFPMGSRKRMSLNVAKVSEPPVKARNRGKSVTTPRGFAQETSKASKSPIFSANATLPITVNEVSSIEERIQRYDSLFAISQEPVTDSDDTTNSGITFVDVSKVESIEKESFICSDDEDY